MKLAAAAAEHDNVIAALARKDGPAARKAIEMDIAWGERNLLKYFDEPEEEAQTAK